MATLEDQSARNDLFTRERKESQLSGKVCQTEMMICREYSTFSSPKILSTDCARRPNASLDDDWPTNIRTNAPGAGKKEEHFLFIAVNGYWKKGAFILTDM